MQLQRCCMQTRQHMQLPPLQPMHTPGVIPAALAARAMGIWQNTAHMACVIQGSMMQLLHGGLAACTLAQAAMQVAMHERGMVLQHPRPSCSARPRHRHQAVVHP